MWRFFLYPDGTKNPWQWWYDGQNEDVRARHDMTIRFLNERREWRRPHAERLTDYEGLIEIIIKTNVQHRLFGFFGPEELTFTVVLPCIHRGKKYKPRHAKDDGFKRMKEIQNGTINGIYCDYPTSA